MSERKSTNKYYPPDYDPIKAEKEARKLSKKLKTMNKSSITIRLMTPFSMRCLKCNEFIPKSRKFNAKKETLDEKYLGKIRIYKFEMRCPSCNNLISFRTDPKSGDYIMDTGGIRNFTGSGDIAEQQEEDIEHTLERLEKEQELELNGEVDERDRMEQLEERLANLQKEQEDDAELEKLVQIQRGMSTRAQIVGDTKKQNEQDQEVLDEIIAEQVFQQNDTKSTDNANSTTLRSTSTVSSTVIPKSISLKRKNKNPFGVMVKRKRKD